MRPDIPSPLLRSFIAVVDGGSLAAAALRVGRSDSAVSLQMARLEDIVGQPLFDRDGRALKLNQAGAVLLAHARAILARIDTARAELGAELVPAVKIGVVQDFVAQVLRPTLAEMLAANPAAQFEIVVGSTAELLQAMGEDRIDTALCAGDLVGAKAGLRLPMRWFGEAALLQQDVVPLVSITPPCPFLRAAQQALDALGRPWRLALVTPSLDGLRAAVQAGLGIACRTEIGLALPPLPPTGWPDLPDIAYSVIERAQPKLGRSAAAISIARHLEQLRLQGQT